jgi:hypothetical protein
MVIQDVWLTLTAWNGLDAIPALVNVPDVLPWGYLESLLRRDLSAQQGFHEAVMYDNDTRSVLLAMEQLYYGPATDQPPAALPLVDWGLRANTMEKYLALLNNLT